MIAFFAPAIAVALSPYWYLLPLVVVVSLVYSATRHEALALIGRHAVRLGMLISVFMAVALVILLAVQSL